MASGLMESRGLGEKDNRANERKQMKLYTGEE